MPDPTPTAELIAIIAALIPLAIWAIRSAEQRLVSFRHASRDRSAIR